MKPVNREVVHAAVRDESAKKDWRESIEAKFWEEKHFASEPTPPNEIGNALSEPRAPETTARDRSLTGKDFEAAMFTLRQLLETPRYLKLELTEERLESLAREASVFPLPQGAMRVEKFESRLRRSLDTEKKHAKAMSGTPGKPIRGRFRPTLRYDHKKRLSPSETLDKADLTGDFCTR